MALLPYLLDDLGSVRVRDRVLGLDLADEVLGALLDRHRIHHRRHNNIRPWRNTTLSDLGSTIKADKDKFQVNIDVHHFDPEDISVKTVDGYIVVEGKHEERKDDHGFVSRQFVRRYELPEGCNPETIESKLSSDGVLVITAPKSQLKNERTIPISHTGPVRRKIQEEENDKEEEPKEDTEEVKSPQKKRRR